ncbi:phosphogluconate dehydrogenase (NAD(+)-dependent, decarboxylating) [Aneurinibacillus aneurinilyticus]|uniref:Phosphogluconate dehydrogenase n=1 Tax=Aneurinibacillus aneurinilyticus ATCC 12856 TaxID=649747 RepID=U1YIK4_ANEAE|nr:decarboxylating 6-phosphogluconate dehydrogenase [Aneurinibacillus aneurinilyticus]ERI10621.1 phosphogluconate dehydrogenase [Aneurinibacillus aneurinilyticus ATCC 12856]MED0708043.1 decarboxylating 6-phosphogluconate dehydrogenase [Aneurinibacillus aneurinilyticus]MED0722150.1 decarboxylating 6-phosphogluconate dehydrogenase [Aneurinibacillus aneurinilyticus]MED0731223.1 decarboxylating 6-phosphogluconate dehydrogenase [Aneurinibacillus aneurinilyticus]MED0741851.1 decarboxylating 6-phosph
MKVGLIGLGKMGYNLALNMLDKKYEVVAYDTISEQVKKITEEGAQGVNSLSALIQNLETPRTVIMLVPAGNITGQVVDELSGLLEKGDILVDAGNSNYKDTLLRYTQLKEKGIYFVDCGTSGGTEGARHGVCTMVGGDAEALERVAPLFEKISIPDGFLKAGAAGSGHFLKMVHNGIEYGMMQAIGEGFEILDKSQFDYNYEAVARVWNNGSVIRSWLMELMQSAFSKQPNLEHIKGVMNSSGEGVWTVETAMELQANAPVIAMSQFMRFRSLEDDTFHGKVVAALRNEFGGHAIVSK